MRSSGKRAAAIIADRVVSAMAPLVVRSTAGRVPPSPRVLVIRCDHIGDAVMATAVLRPLRDALQPSRLDVLAGPWAASLFEAHPDVDGVITVAAPWWSAARGNRRSWRHRLGEWIELANVVRRIRAARYDVGIDLRGDLRQIALFLAGGGITTRVSSDRTGGRRLLTHVGRHDPSLHEVEKNRAVAALLGANGPPRLDVASFTHSPAALSVRGLDSAPPRAYAVLAVHGREANRGWPPAHAAVLADALFSELGLVSVLIGSASDHEAAETIRSLARSEVVNAAGRTSLPQLLAVLREAAITVAIDSGPMHLACAVGSPVVALFGPGDPRQSGPWCDRSQVVSAGAPCGCLGRGCHFVEGPGSCMRAIEPHTVLDAVRLVLNRRPRYDREGLTAPNA